MFATLNMTSPLESSSNRPLLTAHLLPFSFGIAKRQAWAKQELDRPGMSLMLALCRWIVGDGNKLKEPKKIEW